MDLLNAGVKDASDKKILVDMLFWAVDNPPPANYLLISGDRDFSNALHQLRMRRYNILLAQPPNVSQALVAAAKKVWLWTTLLNGGPPLAEMPQFHNASGSSSSTVETPVSTVPHSTQPTDSKQKNQINGKVDTRNKGKQNQNRKTQNQQNSTIPRTTSNGSLEAQQPNVPGASMPKQKNGAKQPSPASSSKISGPGAQKSTHVNINRSSSSLSQSSLQIPPASNNSHLSNVPISGFAQPRPGVPGSYGNSPHQAQYSQPPRPSDPFPPHLNLYSQPPRPSDPFPPHLNPQPWNLSEPNSIYNSYPPAGTYGPSFSTPSTGGPVGLPFGALPGKSSTLPCPPSQAMPRGPPGRSSTPPCPPSSAIPRGPPFASMPDMSKLTISEYPNGVHDNNTHGSTTSMGNNNTSDNGLWGSPGCPEPSTLVQGQMGFILRALHVLKSDKMAPTEANIADCIRYGEMNIPNFNVRMALDNAIEHQVVVVHKLGNNLPLYVGKNDALWKCINVIDSNVKDPESKFDIVLKFLSSAEGRAAILSSECRYHAAVILKKGCLKDKGYALGKILRILHVILHVRKWVVPHASGWQPLTLTISSDSDVSVGINTDP